ncbi:MAG: hypothetical protein AB1544_11475 [Pseudomonadota bacterium]|jgi:hypothetical protein
MAEKDSIRSNLDNLDLAASRIQQAKAMATVLAIATSSGASAPPAGWLVSQALNGVTALLEQAEIAADSVSLQSPQQEAEQANYNEAAAALCRVITDRGRRTGEALLNKYGVDRLPLLAVDRLAVFTAECEELRAAA